MNVTDEYFASAAVRRPLLSVLDLATVGVEHTTGTALQASTDLARRADELGFHRYWVAEHHNMPGIASTTPAVLIAHLAAATDRIRLGSGGVMLPNHAPLVVAEQFSMLEALYPGRVDLGIGRAPGTDPTTAAALRRTPEGLGAEEFPSELSDLLAMLDDPTREEPRPTRLKATPVAETAPSVWLLGSSGYSAQVAGALGLPFSFAHHFSSRNTDAAVELYRSSFTPSAVLDAPYLMIAQSVFVAETAERAEWMAGPMRLHMLALRAGKPGALVHPDTAAARELTDVEQQALEQWPSQPAIGDPETVRIELEQLAVRTGADELMVTTNVYDSADRVRSLELLAEAWRCDRSG